MDSPIGTWSATVRTPTRVSELELRLTADGKASLRTGGSTGSGTWRRTADGRFTFHILERLPTGCVLIDQDGVLRGDGFHSTGTSRVYDGAGRLVRSVHPTVTARRVAPR